MSGFIRPITPTKHPKSISNVNSGSSSNLSSSTKVLEDINLLLHLEALKRGRDSAIMTRQKIEEAYKVFQERRFKYLHLFAKYTMIVKHALTRKVLLRNDLTELHTSSASVNTKCIKEKLSSGSATDYINTMELLKFKMILQLTEKYENLPNRRSELVELQNATKAIQYSIEAIEVSLENCIIHGLDQFTDTLNMEKLPKTYKAYQQKNK